MSDESAKKLDDAGKDSKDSSFSEEVREVEACSAVPVCIKPHSEKGKNGLHTNGVRNGHQRECETPLRSS